MSDFIFMWAVLMIAATVGYITGAHNVQKQWRRRMAWTMQEQSIEQQMAEDGWQL